MKIPFTTVIPHLIVVFLFAACGGDSDDTVEVTNNYLSSLNVVGHTIEFERDTFGVYEISVASDVDSVELSVTPEETDVEIRYEIRSEERIDNFIVNPAESFIVALSEGTNIISISLAQNGSDTSTSYVLEVYKVRSSASISTLIVSEFSGVESSTVLLNPEFASNIFDYTGTVSYNSCAVAMQIGVNENETQAQVNNEEIDINFVHYENLNVGDNFIEVEVTSEDETLTERYSLFIEREASTEEQFRGDATLRELELQDIDFNYVCGIDQYNVAVDFEVDRINLRANPTVDGVTIDVNGVTVANNSFFPVEIENNSGNILITTRALNGETINSISINYARRTRNIVNVATTDELRQALINASPNDEIRLEEGVYQAVSESQLDEEQTPSLFISDRSGTVNEPIVLTVENIGDEVVLQSDNALQNVLSIRGQHWEIYNLEISGGLIGIELDNSHHVNIRNLSFYGAANAGLSVKNGSSNNVIALSEFSRIGDEEAAASAVIIGSDESMWNESPAGNGEEIGDVPDNTIRQNEFNSLNNAHAVKVEEGATNTVIEYNAFAEERKSIATNRSALVSIQGNDSVVRYNNFEYFTESQIDSLIGVSPQTESWHQQNWGENTHVYQNIFDLNGQDIALVSAESGVRVRVAENTRSDGGELTYIGSDIAEGDFEVPIYQIQVADDDRRCLGLEYLDDNESILLVVVKMCSDEQSLRWKLIADTSPFVLIKNVTEEDGFMRTVSDFLSRCFDSEIASSFVFLDEDTQGYIQRWLVDYNNDDVILRSRKESSFGLTIPGNTFSIDTPLLTCSISGSEQQRFRLVQVN